MKRKREHDRSVASFLVIFLYFFFWRQSNIKRCRRSQIHDTRERQRRASRDLSFLALPMARKYLFAGAACAFFFCDVVAVVVRLNILV